jgi:tRNA(Arg) A34 adenosine deaminase TadA
MNRALLQAHQAFLKGEVPVGVVMVHDLGQEILFEGHNLVETLQDPTAHGEMVAIRETCRHLGTSHLGEVSIYVTLEPCGMCAQALGFARVRKIVFGAFNPKGGGIDHGARVFETSGSTFRPQIVGGVEETACQEILKAFFQTLR